VHAEDNRIVEDRIHVGEVRGEQQLLALMRAAEVALDPFPHGGIMLVYQVR
jgi:hypothetical protein